VSVEPFLAAIREQSEAAAQVIATLSAESWDATSNCPPWRIRDLAAHMVTSGQGFVGSIRRGLAGSVEPPPRGSGTDLVHADPATVSAAFRSVTDEFIGVYAELSEEQLETICFHRRGNRSIRWYAGHRLAEIAFHAWDLQTSLGREPNFDEGVAKLLLPTLIESNVPRTYAAGLSQERGRGERFALCVENDPSLRWVVRIDPDDLRVTTGEADAQITTDAATLALLVYGRATLDDTHTEGDSAALERFPLIFPRP
jgi:uncharacterized protein (TIGR03083 family)